MNASDSVAVIDVGSNTIKLLVARRSARGGLDTVLSKTIDARISRGIAHASPVLGEEGMAAGLQAVVDLVAAGREAGAGAFVIVATSAVRGARNGAEFAARVASATGISLHVLSGDEEANLIGRGLLADPGLGEFGDFYVFDLGGGSLECLFFRGKQIASAISLPLGCVRLTERFMKNPAAPVTASELDAVSNHVRAALSASGFPFGQPAPAVFAGGTMTTARAIRAAADGRGLMESPREVSRGELAQLLRTVSALPLELRRTDIKGLPPTRADVFPAALATMLAVAEVGRFDSFTHSFYNLRYGIAADVLGRDPAVERASSAPATAD